MIGAAVRGADYLRHTTGSDHPALWHDKDLYAPKRVIAAEILAAQHLVHSRAGDRIGSGR